MKKLYNIYKEVILEVKSLILEGAPSTQQLHDAIHKHHTVNIVYDDGTNHSSNQPRYCGVYAYGTTSNGHAAIRVYQISGPNLKAKSKVSGIIERWKTLRVDRITGWYPTKFVFHAPADNKFNHFQDKTLNLANGDLDNKQNIASFSDKQK